MRKSTTQDPVSLSFSNDGPLGTFFRYICDNGTRIFLRLSAFILLCIGLQILWNGANTLVTSLSHSR
jgi:Bacterial oxidoreductases, C-terminal